jgi:hypothetical protein
MPPGLNPLAGLQDLLKAGPEIEKKLKENQDRQIEAIKALGMKLDQVNALLADLLECFREAPPAATPAPDAGTVSALPESGGTKG